MDEHNPWHGLMYNAGVRVAVIGVLAILALFLAAETVSIAQDLGRSGNPATDTITVQGEGRATVPPNVAHISFSVENTAAIVSDAQAATTKQANAALGFVKGQGIAENDVKTLAYTITPQYAYRVCLAGEICPSTGKITGYQVSQTVQVTLHDLSMVGTMLEGLGTLQVQNVNGPNFALDDSTAGYDAARADAINKAQAQARLIARELGVGLGKIVNFSESSGGYPYATDYGMGGITLEKVVSTPTVPAGENTYNASVSITYEIR